MTNRGPHDPSNDFSDLEAGSTDISPAYARADEAFSGSFVLRVLRGPDTGKTLRIDDATPSALLVGQGPACALRLTDPEVSRRHASFELVDRRLRITDLRSTNGTFVEAIAITEAYVTGGETVRLGATTLRVERTTEATKPLPQAHNFGRVLGASRAMRRLYPMLERLAASAVPAVIEGETGTGKEALAETLHACGPRAARPFVVFDCTAVAPSLVESELFGHEKGAFTGAISARRGVFEQAHGGTLLIDEIGDLDVALQPKLLRAIERSEIRRVGSERVIPVDVRVLAATRRNLDDEITAGRFRDDLFYRLAVARIELPPLRKREGDVRLLVRHFWRELGGDPSALRDEMVQRWESEAWPGNIRQLRNAVARRLALGDLRDVRVEELDDDAEDDAASKPAPSEGTRAPEKSTTLASFVAQCLDDNVALPVARAKMVKELEQAYIAAVLERHGGNVPRAAEASGIARRYFQILRVGTRR